jgi:hypothetical protein
MDAMLTQEQVLEAVKNKSRDPHRENCAVLDSRDYRRLCDFFPSDRWEAFGFSLKDGAVATEPKPWTLESIMAQMRSDLEFAINKAENQRGISSSLMFDVMKMWMWVLEDDLQSHDDYYDYGLPFYRMIEAKYPTTTDSA